MERRDICVFGSLNVDLTVRMARFHAPGETVTGESVWEKLKRAPLLPAASKKSEVDKLLGLKSTVGGSESYKSESGYTVEL